MYKKLWMWYFIISVFVTIIILIPTIIAYFWLGSMVWSDITNELWAGILISLSIAIILTGTSKFAWFLSFIINILIIVWYIIFCWNGYNSLCWTFIVLLIIDITLTLNLLIIKCVSDLNI